MSTPQLRESFMFEYVEPNVSNFYIRVTKDQDGKYPHVGVQAYNLTTPEMAFTPDQFSSLLQWLVSVHQRVVALNTPPRRDIPTAIDETGTILNGEVQP